MFKNILLSIWSVICFAGGIAFYIFIKKPDTVINNTIKKVKTTGENNDVDVTNKPETKVDNGKKKFLLFGRKK